MRNSVSKSNEKSAERVKELIHSRNLTQEQFAEVIDVTPNYVSMIICGNRSLSKKLAEKISNKFEGVYVPYLLGLTDGKNQMEDELLKLTDLICHHRIVAMRNYLETLGYHWKMHDDHFTFTLYSPDDKVLCSFTDPDFDDLSSDVYDFVKMKLLKMQGRF